MTRATTSPITAASIPPTERCAISAVSSTRRTGAGCASSPSSCSITPPTSTRGSSARGVRRRQSPIATGTCGATTPNRYSDARIIFRDFEHSNWTWDPIANQYFWHRFYAHQPDLNFDNPEVRREMLRTVEYWLDMGVDGLRLDAVPYLFEREGTALREPARDARLPPGGSPLRRRALRTTACCSRKRTSGRKTRPSTSARATSARWRSTFRSCRGCSWACGWKTGSRSATSCARPRDPPDACQWAVFLRNHDELTLEMVTDEERDYMYRAYAHEPANADQPRYPPPARTAAAQPPAQDRADARVAVLTSRHARACTTATRSAWATTSTSATATACARRCNGAPTATPASRRRTRSA